ncbi:MAG: hypothetical protein WD295_02555, partial [Bacteroidota bacterium]
LNIIESQYSRISELEAEVRELSGRIDRLSGDHTAMMGEMEKLRGTTADVDSLNALIITLRRGLRERDQMIFALVDSLFLQYEKDFAAMKDVEKEGVASRLERRNVFSNLKQSISDNIRFLERTALSDTDIAALAAEQKKFESRWRGLGSKLTELYGGTRAQRRREIATIDSLLVAWKERIDEAYWKGLGRVFGARELEIAEFRSADEFRTSLLAFLDTEIAAAKAGTTPDAYQRYSLVADSIWTGEILPAWLPALSEAGVWTEDHTREVGAKLREWENTVSPPATLLYIIVILVILAIVVFLFGRYRKMHAPVQETTPPVGK